MGRGLLGWLSRRLLFPCSSRRAILAVSRGVARVLLLALFLSRSYFLYLFFFCVVVEGSKVSEITHPGMAGPQNLPWQAAKEER